MTIPVTYDPQTDKALVILPDYPGQPTIMFFDEEGLFNDAK